MRARFEKQLEAIIPLVVCIVLRTRWTRGVSRYEFVRKRRGVKFIVAVEQCLIVKSCGFLPLIQAIAGTSRSHRISAYEALSARRVCS